jgi:hypothetical protein
MNKIRILGISGRKFTGSFMTPAKGVCIMKEETMSRRDVLRGALAVVCSLCLPVTLSACDSNKGANSSSSAPATSSNSAAPTGTRKASQASVRYQNQPKGEQNCGNCVNFIAGSNSCKLVDGEISPEGWCSLWAKKT